MTAEENLYRRLLFAPFPSLGKEVGHFPMWDDWVGRYAARMARGDPLDEGALHMEPDDETALKIAELRSKPSLTLAEKAFLEYCALLKEVGAAVTAEARRQLNRPMAGDA